LISIRTTGIVNFIGTFHVGSSLKNSIQDGHYIFPNLRPPSDRSSPSSLWMPVTQYCAATCIQCHRMTTDCSLYRCHHGEREYSCTNCRQVFLSALSSTPPPPLAAADHDHERRTYTNMSSTSTTTALDTVLSGCHVCNRYHGPVMQIETDVITPTRVQSIAVGPIPGTNPTTTQQHEATTRCVLSMALLLVLIIVIIWIQHFRS
jgi:hypothetical protein